MPALFYVVPGAERKRNGITTHLPKPRHLHIHSRTRHKLAFNITDIHPHRPAAAHAAHTRPHRNRCERFTRRHIPARAGNAGGSCTSETRAATLRGGNVANGCANRAKTGLNRVFFDRFFSYFWGDAIQSRTNCGAYRRHCAR